MFKTCRLIPIIVGLAIPVVADADALQATLIVESQEVSAVEPRLTDGEMLGNSISLGDANGDRGRAKIVDGRRLDRDVGRGPFLGYLGHGEFVRLGNTVTHDSRVVDVAAAELRKQGAPKDRAIDVTMLARLDLDADGIEEMIVQAHTVRDPKNPYLGRPNDIEAILVLAQNGRIEVRSWITVAFDPNESNGARMLLELLALGRGPSGAWDLLVGDKAQYVGKLPPDINIMINGKPMDQTNEIKLRRTDFTAVVYHWSNGQLSTSDLLQTTHMYFCSIADCKASDP